RHTRFSRDWSSDVCSSDLARFGDPRYGYLAAFGVSAVGMLIGLTIYLLFRHRVVEAARPATASDGAVPAVEVPHDVQFRRYVARSEERRVGKGGRSRGAGS